MKNNEINSENLCKNWLHFCKNYVKNRFKKLLKIMTYN